MTIYCSKQGGTVTAWIEQGGVRVYEASGDSLAEAGWRLIEALANRDDPQAKPRIVIVEK
jgi:hypothetical protein